MKDIFKENYVSNQAEIFIKPRTHLTKSSFVDFMDDVEKVANVIQGDGYYDENIAMFPDGSSIIFNYKLEMSCYAK